jgi:Ca2+-binding EF-hand superfamily protein
LDEFMQINSLDDDLAWAFDIDEMEADYFDIDGDGYISEDDLHFFVLMRLCPHSADEFCFTRGHAQLAVMMADRDGDGKLNMAEMQTLVDGSYKDDTMQTPGLSTA